MQTNRALAFLALVFAALFSYWTFNQIQFYLTKDKDRAFENLPDTSSAFTQNLPDTNAAETAGVSDSKMAEKSTWTATDYSQGDISKGGYTVKSGDTLWEIAEAVYGDGTQWINILNANSNSIDYLPNGQQALIFPGQVLQIP
jgi:nucleoid-associated protein YgaU